MTSQRKIEANRRNAQKAKGPRSAGGKARSSKNARKHGLAIPIGADRDLHDRALQIAGLIVGDEAPDEFMDQALTVAEPELELQRIGRARTCVVQQNIRQPSANGQPNDESDALAAAFIKALPTLSRIDRYERRTLSKKRRPRST
jgi:hypothetical protein